MTGVAAARSAWEETRREYRDLVDAHLAEVERDAQESRDAAFPPGTPRLPAIRTA